MVDDKRMEPWRVEEGEGWLFISGRYYASGGVPPKEASDFALEVIEIIRKQAELGLDCLADANSAWVCYRTTVEPHMVTMKVIYGGDLLKGCREKIGIQMARDARGKASILERCPPWAPKYREELKHWNRVEWDRKTLSVWREMRGG